MGDPGIRSSSSFTVDGSILAGYALLTLGLSLAVLRQSALRGPEEFQLWVAAYVGIAVVSLWRPRWSPLVAGSLAFLLGIVKTHCAGPNLDLGLGLIALSVSVHLLDRLRRGESTTTDPAGLALLLLAVWTIISLAFAVARVRGFTPAPGFEYHTYPFNPLRLSSDEAIIRATTVAAIMVSWFGLYEYGRTVRVPRAVLRGMVTGLVGLNAVVLLVQQRIDPFFLLHAGQSIGRLNGVTSYCYALGDAIVAFFLLLPAWGATRGAGALQTGGTLALLAYAVAASGSRTALIVMFLAGGAWIARWVLRLSGLRRRVITGLCLAVVAVAAVGFSWMYRITSAEDVTLIGRIKLGVERDGVLGHLVETRLWSYPLVAQVIGAYPLSGVGVGLYPAEVSKQHALLTPDAPILDSFLMSSFAPNQFLNAGVELGLPGLMALIVAFAWVGGVAFSRRKEGLYADLTVSVAVLALALQVSPSLLTSEALVFFWLLLGLAARPAPGPAGGAGRSRGPCLSASLLLGATLLGVVGQLLARPSLAVDAQWQRLRWPMNLALYAPDEGGRWTRPEATFTVNTPRRELRLRWHVGDVAAPRYRARVSFYVDGRLAERSVVGSGPIRESVLPLPHVTGLKRISVQVDPPFLPGPTLGRDDPRRLGIFIHGPGARPWQPRGVSADN